MKKIGLLLLIMAVSVLVGCTSVHKKWDANSASPDIDTKLIADVETTGKISGSASQRILFWVFPVGGETEYADGVGFSARIEGEGNPLSQMFSAFNFVSKAKAKCKSAAAYNALEGSGADYILNPRYSYKITDYSIYKEVTATVYGMGCIIKGYRQTPDAYHFGCCGCED
ncbi:MAG: hypothetical protein KGY61_06040 [Desulfobacterales bacterium]|nr:hypothetical protein [Desulfobacterales bacterium]